MGSPPAKEETSPPSPLASARVRGGRYRTPFFFGCRRESSGRRLSDGLARIFLPRVAAERASSYASRSTTTTTTTTTTTAIASEEEEEEEEEER